PTRGRAAIGKTQYGCVQSLILTYCQYLTCEIADEVINRRKSEGVSRAFSTMPIEPQTSIPTDPLVSRIQRDSLTRVIRRAEAGDVSIQAERQVVRDLIASEGFSGRAPEQCVVAFKTLLNEA